MLNVNGTMLGFKVARTPTNSLLIYYSGKPEDLVNAGAIAADLLALRPSGRPRWDVDGDRCFVTRTQNGSVIICRSKSEQKALALPGVYEWLLDERGPEVRSIVDQALRKFVKVLT